MSHLTLADRGRQFDVVRLHATFCGVLHLHADVHIGVFPVANLEAQTICFK